MINLAEVNSNTKTISLEELYNKIIEKDLIVKKYELTENEKSNVISKIFCRLPLQIVFVRDANSLNTIFLGKEVYAISDFINNRFKYVSNIEGISDNYFNEMPKYLQRRILQSYITLQYIKINDESFEELKDILKE